MRDIGSYLLAAVVVAVESLLVGQVVRWIWEVKGGK